jgi:hypothetical protein
VRGVQVQMAWRSPPGCGGPGWGALLMWCTTTGRHVTRCTACCCCYSISGFPSCYATTGTVTSCSCAGLQSLAAAAARASYAAVCSRVQLLWSTTQLPDRAIQPWHISLALPSCGRCKKRPQRIQSCHRQVQSMSAQPDHEPMKTVADQLAVATPTYTCQAGANNSQAKATHV